MPKYKYKCTTYICIKVCEKRGELWTATITSQNISLLDQLEDLENRSGRSNLRILNIPEEGMWRRERPHHLYIQATERCYGSRHFLHLSWTESITHSDLNLQRVSWHSCLSCIFTNTETGSWNWDGPGNIREVTSDCTMTWVQFSPEDGLRLTQLREVYVEVSQVQWHSYRHAAPDMKVTEFEYWTTDMYFHIEYGWHLWLRSLSLSLL